MTKRVEQEQFDGAVGEKDGVDSLSAAILFIQSQDWSAVTDSQSPELTADQLAERAGIIETNWAVVVTLLQKKAVQNGAPAERVSDPNDPGPFFVVGRDDFATSATAKLPKVLLYHDREGQTYFKVYRPDSLRTTLFEQEIPGLSKTDPFFAQPHTELEIAMYVDLAITTCLAQARQTKRSVSLKDSKYLN